MRGCLALGAVTIFTGTTGFDFARAEVCGRGRLAVLVENKENEKMTEVLQKYLSYTHASLADAARLSPDLRSDDVVETQGSCC